MPVWVELIRVTGYFFEVARKGYWLRIEDVCCEKRKIFEKQDKVKSRIKLSKD